MSRTISSTTEGSLCIGCGICRAACASRAINMVQSGDGVCRPVVDLSRCVDCGQCVQVCPQHPDRIASIRAELAKMPRPEAAGVLGAKCYLAWTNDTAGRRRSASGGVATAMALHLLATGAVDGVMHVHRLAARRGEAHYRAVLSRTAEEVEAGRGSAYETIDFSEVLDCLKPGNCYFAIGTPCVVRGLKELVSVHPRFHGIRLYTCALVCSHNVSPRFADALADRLKIADVPFLVDFRDKWNNTDAGKCNTRYFLENGDDLYRENRNASGWTKLWRSFAFAPTACRQCPDFWGLVADMSVKDAWGDKEWTADPLGRSVVLFRDAELERAFRSCDITARSLAEEKVARMQLPQSMLKQAGVVRKKPLLRDCQKKILVAGGYGYGNAGDEAQCAETLRLLRERYPEFQIENLSPDPDYSHCVHPGFHHVLASRVAVFNQGRSHDWYRLSGCGRKLGFLVVSLLLYLNASRVRKGRATFLLNARRSAFLQRIAEASLFYYCGGGYLTGATKSRLWEAILTCAIGRKLGVPVVMSGQTIGLWNGFLERRFAHWGFRDVAVIGLRDNVASAKDLAAIGIDSSRIIPTHDDALFCEKARERQVACERYLTVNFHFWGMKGAVRTEVLAKLKCALALFRSKFGIEKVVFIPMHVSDLKSYYAYQGLYPDPDLEVLECNSDFRCIRRAIADSTALLTMKHHPIIFAVGEDTPVVSMAYSTYYVHKNFGAMQQYGVECCSMDLAADGWESDLVRALDRARDVDWFRRCVRQGREDAVKRRERFLKVVDSVMGAQAPL